ncbi:hypothetical protein MUN46_011135 [Mesosutterella sp. AGMB02718]|uniref:Uncharacterized protein n=1 Tax=Mesosutterella faecium TaxID=2925194 RepID=A0ABT7IQ20_9BURK|nr:hypothetical protein [Mesosutterella sp. AGMB02718]MDL2060490.1 hypothetical protein [Mesosutterella sp. AGMB02718]
MPASALRARRLAQPRGKFCVREVEPGLFDECLPNILAKGRKQIDAPRRHDPIEPSPGRFCRDAGFLLKRAESEFLSIAGVQNCDELLKDRDVPNPGCRDALFNERSGQILKKRPF